MKGYKETRDEITSLNPGETCVIVGFQDHFHLPVYESDEVAKEMLRQCQTIDPQLKDYFATFRLTAKNYAGNVIRLPHYELCCKVKYEDRFNVSYDDIMRALATSLKYRKEYENWLPNAAWTPDASRGNRELTEPTARNLTLNKRFPKTGGFIAYITPDRGYSLFHCADVDAIGIKVRMSESSKLTPYMVDPLADACVFFNNRWEYTDAYIIRVLRKAYNDLHDTHEFEENTVIKAQHLISPAEFGLKYKGA